jgi:hypothetical protein
MVEMDHLFLIFIRNIGRVVKIYFILFFFGLKTNGIT